MKRLVFAGFFFLIVFYSVFPAAVEGNGTLHPIYADGIEQHECDQSEWYFVISDIKESQYAPRSIEVSWTDGSALEVLKWKLDGSTAHYVTTAHLDSPAASASLQVYGTWDDQFHLIHGPCNFGDNNIPAPVCSDAVDNDSDGKIDYPADPGCSSIDDNDETDPIQQTPPAGGNVGNGGPGGGGSGCQECGGIGGGGPGPGGPTINVLEIRNEKATRVGNVINVTWETNYLATSWVAYGTASVNPPRVDPHLGYATSTIQTASTTKEHVVIIPDTDPAKTYYLRPASQEHFDDQMRVVGRELVVTPGDVAGASSGGGVGSSVATTGGSGGGGATTNITPISISPLSPVQPNTTPGQCGLYLNEYIKFDKNNNAVEVYKLQIFLNSYEGFNLTLTGVYDTATLNAVNIFQERYHDAVLEPWGLGSATGYVYITTSKKINDIYCVRLGFLNTDFPLTADQKREINDYRAYIKGTKVSRGQESTKDIGGAITPEGDLQKSDQAKSKARESLSEVVDKIGNVINGAKEIISGAATSVLGNATGTRAGIFTKASDFISKSLAFVGGLPEAFHLRTAEFIAIVLLIIICLIANSMAIASLMRRKSARGNANSDPWDAALLPPSTGSSSSENFDPAVSSPRETFATTSEDDSGIAVDTHREDVFYMPSARPKDSPQVSAGHRDRRRDPFRRDSRHRGFGSPQRGNQQEDSGQNRVS